MAAPAHPWSWGGGEATAPTPSWPQQPATDGYPSGDYSSGNYAPQGYPSDGYTLESYPSGTYPPETCPPGGYPSGNYSAGGYNPESYTTGDYQSGDYASMAPASAAQFSAAAAVAPQSFAPPDQAPQEGWMAPQWNDPQWGAGVVDPAAQGSLQAQPWVSVEKRRAFLEALFSYRLFCSGTFSWKDLLLEVAFVLKCLGKIYVVIPSIVLSIMKAGSNY